MTRPHATRPACIDDAEYNRHVERDPLAERDDVLTPAEVAQSERFWAQVAADLDRLAARTDARSRAVAALYRRALNNRNRSRPGVGRHPSAEGTTTATREPRQVGGAGSDAAKDVA